jgi:hypothetical protein
MKLSTFALIITVLATGFGLAFILIPVKLMALYGISLESSGIVLGRYYGVSNLFVGMIFWSYSSVSPAAKSWPRLLLYSIIYEILQLVVTLKAMLDKQENSMGWTTIALFALLAIGSGYFLNKCNKARAELSL